MRINVSALGLALAALIMCFSGNLGASGEITKAVLLGSLAGLIVAVDYTWHEFNKGDRQ